MVMKQDQQKLRDLLKETITLLCKNGLAYTDQFSVEALIGITLDKDDVMLVSISETVSTTLSSKGHGMGDMVTSETCETQKETVDKPLSCSSDDISRISASSAVSQVKVNHRKRSFPDDSPCYKSRPKKSNNHNSSGNELQVHKATVTDRAEVKPETIIIKKELESDEEQNWIEANVSETLTENPLSDSECQFATSIGEEDSCTWSKTLPGIAYTSQSSFEDTELPERTLMKSEDDTQAGSEVRQVLSSCSYI